MIGGAISTQIKVRWKNHIQRPHGQVDRVAGARHHMVDIPRWTMTQNGNPRLARSIKSSVVIMRVVATMTMMLRMRNLRRAEAS